MDNNKIELLDHKYVRLVESMGSDLSVVRAARVSYDAAWRAGEDKSSDTRLIRYLAANQHTTPFEAVEFQFEVKAPIFVFCQWHRHRTRSFNELSARYRKLPKEFYVLELEQITTQSTNNKQARTTEQHPQAANFRMFTEDVGEIAFGRYRTMIANGRPQELARSVLPTTYSHMFAKVDLLNLLKFLKLRDHDHAQYEIRVCAQAMAQLAREVAPVSVAAWLDR